LDAESRPWLVLSGDPGVYALESAATLTNWMRLTQLTNLDGSFEFIDEPVTNTMQRFYRAVRLE